MTDVLADKIAVVVNAAMDRFGVMHPDIPRELIATAAAVVIGNKVAIVLHAMQELLDRPERVTEIKIDACWQDEMDAAFQRLLDMGGGG